MKRCIISIVFLIFAIIAGAIWLKYSKQKSTELLISSVVGENRFLKDSFNSLLTIDSIAMDSIWLKHGKDVIKLSELVSFPCLIIYLPSIKEDICNSCIDYALTEAMQNSRSFADNNHVCIISVNHNPEVKERIYKKKCYYVDESFLNVPQMNMPYYFVLDKDGYVDCLFAPNSLFKECTSLYWKLLECRCLRG